MSTKHFADKDYHLWNKWKENKDKESLANLMDNFQPLIHNNLKPLRGTVPDSVLESEAHLQAVKAFKSYNPNRNTKLSTHVTNQLPKVNRLVYNSMDLVSIPEARRIKYKNYEAITSNLTEELGRPPTTDEIADELGWSQSEVRRHKAESWKELSDTVPGIVDTTANHDPNHAIMSYVYNDLSPRHKKVYEYTTGYSGTAKKSDADVMHKMNLTRGQLSYAKKVIKKKLQQAIGQYGG